MLPLTRLLSVIVWASLLSVTTVSAETITGTMDDDNNSFSRFPIWRGQLEGTPREDSIVGLEGHDILLGRAGNDRLLGGPGRDHLYGDAGADLLHGGFDDRDILVGGGGDDVYLITDGRDLIREQADQGLDTVRAYVDYSLPRDVENLQLMPDHLNRGGISGGSDGEPAVHFLQSCDDHELDVPCEELGSRGYGNSLDNQILGNGMDNRLRGMAGNDTLFGGNGDDQVEGGDGDDILAAFSLDQQSRTTEVDVLKGGPGADLFVIGISGRPGGLLSYLDEIGGQPIETEAFPQYLGEGSVTIRDFDHQEGDRIEVYGDPRHYRVKVEYSAFCGGYCAGIFWKDAAGGYARWEYLGKVMSIRSPDELVPERDFL